MNPDHFLRELYNDEDDFSDTEVYQDVAENEENTDAVEHGSVTVKIEPDDDFDNRSPSPRPCWQSQTEPKFSYSESCPDGFTTPNHLRERSRSPHRPDNTLDEPFPVPEIVMGEEEEEVVEDEFLVPDAHEVYGSPESDVSDLHAREKSVRRRGGRRGRSGRGRPTRGRKGDRWAVGDPLQFIYITDADVPRELANMVREVIKKRQENLQVYRDRKARRAARELGGHNEENNRDSQEDEEFQDATDGKSHPLLGEQHQKFDWFPMETFQGEEEVFQPQRTGSVRCVESVYDAFRSYWDDTILDHIVEQTNQYATTISSAVFQSDWYPTNPHEILCLFAFWMMLGVIRMPTIMSCFSVNPLLKTEVFRRIFSQKRYFTLTRALHFADADPDDAIPSNCDLADSDLLHRLRPMLDHLNSKFQENYALSKDICIGESVTLWTGRLKFKQHARSKASKIGIKTFELCESATGYLWSFLVYTGKESSNDFLCPSVQKSASVVLKLIKPLLNKGYRLFMDYWYNSPVLARYLKLNKTDCVGSLRPTQQDVPVLLSEAPLKQGQFMARNSGDVCVLAWQDKKRISMLSTCHGAHTALPRVYSKPPTFPQQFTPQMVLDYNKSMGGVDMKDHMLEPYLLERKRCAKWYMKLFKRLLNCSILNARILLQSSSNAVQDHLNFRLQLVDAILASHLAHCPSTNRRTPTSYITRPNHIVSHSHWPVHMEQTAYDSVRNRQNRKRCVVCLNQRRKTQKTAYMCETCKVPLCVVNCFKTFHSS